MSAILQLYKRAFRNSRQHALITGICCLGSFKAFIHEKTISSSCVMMNVTNDSILKERTKLN